MDLGQLLQQQLSQQLSGGLMRQLGQQIGVQDERQTAAASSVILSSLMGALARNASTPDGANALNGALERDHDGSILDHLGPLLTGQRRPDNPRALNGAGILKHILGNQQQETVQEVSQRSGLSLEKAGSLMVTLAPILMQMLGRSKRQAGAGANDLGGVLTDLVTGMGSRNQPQMPGQQPGPDLGLAGQLLDRDGDGQVMDDIADIGMKMLGGFFSNRR